MKKLILILIGILSSLYGIGQQRTLINKVSLILPAGAEKLTREQAVTFAKTIFPQDTLQIGFISKTKLNQLYKAEGTLIFFNTGDGQVTDKFLYDRKREMEGMYQHAHDKTYTANLKTVNNNHALTSSNFDKHIAYYTFDCLNNNYSYIIRGTFKSAVADSAKAKAVMEGILKSIEFTK